MLSAFYGEKYNTTDSLLTSLIFQEYNKFDNINFFLKRTNPFDSFGRLENEMQSDQDHTNMLEFLSNNEIDYTYVDDSDKTIQIIKFLNLGNK